MQSRQRGESVCAISVPSPSFGPPNEMHATLLCSLVLSISSSEEVEGRRLLLAEQPQPARPLQQPVPLRVVDLIVLCQHVRAQVGVLAIVEGLRGRDAGCRAPLELQSRHRALDDARLVRGKM